MKTNAEIVTELHKNEIAWTDCLDALQLIWNKNFITPNERGKIIKKINTFYKRKEASISHVQF